jgi:hypothetical protein
MGERRTRRSGWRTGRVAKEQGVDQGEDGGICADPEGKREHRDGGEAGIFGEDADSVAQRSVNQRVPIAWLPNSGAECGVVSSWTLCFVNGRGVADGTSAAQGFI